MDGGGSSIESVGREIAVGIRRAGLEAAGNPMSLGRGGTPEEAAGAIYRCCLPRVARR